MARLDRKFARRRLAAACVLAALALTTAPARAALPPFGASKVSMVAREQPVGQFLQNLFSQAGLTVVVSPTLTGNVNGVFNGSARKVYADVASAWNLLTYYDGTAVYVYAPSEMSTRALPALPGASTAVVGQVRRLGLTDPQNQVRMRNRMLVATGSKRFLDQVDEVARAEASTGGRGVYSLGAPPPAGPVGLEYRVYYLRYAWAEDISLTLGDRNVTLPGVASILRSLMTSQGGRPAPVAQRFESSVSPVVQGLKESDPNAQHDFGILGLIPTANGVMPPPLANDAWKQLANAQPGQGADAYAGQSGIAQQGGPDSVRVVADSRLNAVIVRDTHERLAAYEQLIRALDIEPQLLEIEATIIDIDTNRLRTLGLNFRLQDAQGRNAALFGNGTASDLSLQPNANITPSGIGFFLSTVIKDGGTFTSRLNALEQNGVAKVVSRPQLLTLSDVEAVFDNTRTFYVRLTGERQVDLYNVTAGTTLRVNPHVTREHGETRIRMLVSIQDGGLTADNVDNIPVVQKAQINTQALILEGQSLLLGGMVVQSDTRDLAKVPVLGDLPVIKYLFRNKTRTNAHTERLFLITPRLASIGSPPTAPGSASGGVATAPTIVVPSPAAPAAVVTKPTPSTTLASEASRKRMQP